MKITSVFLSVISGICIFASGCVHQPSVVSKTTVASKTVLILIDGNASEGPDTDYYFYGQECFVVTYRLGYVQPIHWYYIEQIPENVASAAEYVMAQPGRTIYTSGGFSKIACVRGFSRPLVERYEWDTQDIVERFRTLRKALVRDRYLTNKVPAWISEFFAIKKAAGLEKSQESERSR